MKASKARATAITAARMSSGRAATPAISITQPSMKVQRRASFNARTRATGVRGRRSRLNPDALRVGMAGHGLLQTVMWVMTI